MPPTTPLETGGLFLNCLAGFALTGGVAFGSIPAAHVQGSSMTQKGEIPEAALSRSKQNLKSSGPIVCAERSCGERWFRPVRVEKRTSAAKSRQARSPFTTAEPVPSGPKGHVFLWSRFGTAEAMP